MAITYDPTSGNVRGTHSEVKSLRARLQQAKDASGIVEAFRSAGAGHPVPAEDEILEAVRTALHTPMLTLELVNSGPGGNHHHVIDAGVNAVAVRWSTARPDLSELMPSPFPVLPGELTRLVRFQPGRDPGGSPLPVAVDAAAIASLASEIRNERLTAWSGVRDLLGGAVDREEADASWQLVSAQCAWIAPDGEAQELLAVYLRAGDAYFVLVQDGESLELLPVPSITAWETMMQVLPGADEIKDPRG